MQENRSFDSYLGRLGTYDPTLQSQLLDPVLDYSRTNPNPSWRPTIHAFPPRLCLCEAAGLGPLVGWHSQ